METLTEQIRAINNIPDFVNIDREKAVRELIGVWRKRNSLVENAIRKETSFPKEYQNLIKYTPGLLPKSIPQSEIKRCRELEEVVGDLDLNNASTRYYTPAVLAPGVAVVAAGEYAVLEKIHKSEATRREFLRGAAGFAFMGFLSGGVIGIMPQIASISRRSDAKKNADYVQSTIERLYR